MSGNLVEVPKGSILIVDDAPNNLRLLSTMLTEQGYEVRSVINGAMALMGAKAAPPDLILLDINMPEMNGYEVCQQLKADAKTCEIPVIFISALNEAVDKVKAFAVGGRDYITKPFQVEEVLARVENQLALRSLQKQLIAQNAQLQQEIRDRQKAEEALRVYLHAVSHDLRNPVLGMSMVLNNLLKSEEVNAASEDSANSSGAATLTPGQGISQQSQPPIPKIYNTRSSLERMAQSCDRQLHLINSLLETQELEVWGVPLECQPLNLYTLTQRLIEEWEPMLTKNQATVKHLVSPELPLVHADPNQLWRVFENLIANALKHNPPGVMLTLNAEVVEVDCQELGVRAAREVLPIESSNGEPLTYSTSQPFPSSPRMLRCTLTDNGVGITTEQVEKLFELYTRGTSARRTTGLGLGLYLCRQIITAHGGKIGVISNPNAGATFWFTLPVAEAG